MPHLWPNFADALDVRLQIRKGGTQHGYATVIFQLARSSGDSLELLRVCMLMATARGAFDFQVANLNDIVSFEPIGFADWLEQAWAGQL
jgi:hypothetical protein